MQKFHCCLGVALAVAVLGALAAATGARAAESASLIIIVDGSGSMGGFLEGGGRQTKLALVREALRPALAKVAPQTRIGLAAFGHRRGKDCTDVEIVRTPEPVDVERIVTPVEQISPRGRGPLTLAIREAAKGLPQDSRPRTLLLIHDDADNCRVDLCAAAAELSAAGITAHVVSVGASPNDTAKMACLPQATGGRHFKAQNVEQLALFIGEAVRLASTDPAVADFAATVVPPAPIPASGPAALYLRAVLTPNTEPLNVPLHWTVSAEGQSEAPLFEAWTANPVVPVAPGRYVVAVSHGSASATDIVTVHENRPMAVNIVLGVGALRVRVVAPKTGAQFPDAIVTISATGKGAESPRDASGGPVAVFRASDAMVLLPAGRYIVGAELGLVRSEPRTVDVTARRPIAVDISLDAGRLQLTTGARDGVLALGAPIFSITEDDPPRGRREVARSAARQAEFVLPPGTYYISARQGSVEARERLEIGSGDTVRRTLTAAAGRLSLSTSGPAALAADLVSYTIRPIDDPTQDVVTTSRPAPILFLPSGRYRVEGRYGLTNVRTLREVDIRGAQTLQLSIDHQVATLSLRFAGAATSDVSWEVRDESGRMAWTSGQSEAVATLQAGRYRVVVRAGGKREERDVELRAGESKLVEIR